MDRSPDISSEPSKAETIVSLRRALTVDPADRPAAYALFSQELDAGNRAGAEEALAYLQLHFPGPQTLAAEARLRCAQGRPEEALELVGQLCFAPPDETSALDQAVEAVSNSRQSRELERVLLDSLGEPGVNPEAGAWFVRRFVARNAWGQRMALYELDLDQPVGRRAITVFIQQIAEHLQITLLKRVIKRLKEQLRQQDELWAAVGAAFVQLEEYTAAVKWLSDWRSREEVTPWMLSSLAIALYARKREAEAIEVSRKALELKRDHATPNHQLWLALDEALAGRAEAASAWVDQANAGELEPYFKGLRALVIALLAVHAAPAAQRKKTFKSQRMKFRHPDIRDHLSTGSLKPSTVRALKEMARWSREGYNPFWANAIGQNGRQGRKRGKLSYFATLIIGWLFLLVILAVGVRTCSSLPETPDAPPALPELELRPPVPLGSDDAQPLVIPKPASGRPTDDPVNPPFEISPAPPPPDILPKPELPPPVAIPPPRK